MRLSPSRLAVAAATLVLGFGSACATSFKSGALEPTPSNRGRSAGEPYVQVREYATARHVSLVWLRFSAATKAASETGVTLDVFNDSDAPMTFDLARASLHVGYLDAKPGEHRAALASGRGNLPPRVHLEAAPPGPMTLAPGQEATIWLVFTPSRPEKGRVFAKTFVQIPFVSAQRQGVVAVKITDREASPSWSADPPNDAVVVVLGGGARAYNGAQGRFNDFELGLGYVRGPLSATASARVFTLHEQVRGGLAHAEGTSFGIELGFRPPDWAFGVFASGHTLSQDFDTASFEPDRRVFATAIGLQMPLGGGLVPRATLRLSYEYLFSPSPYHGGVGISLLVPLIRL